MAYASDYQKALQDKPLSGLFLNDYFLSNKLLNAMQFDSKAVNSNANGLSYTVVRNEEVEGAAAAREFGSDYSVVNAKPVPETFYLKVFGGKYQIDTTFEDVIKNINTENEAREKMNAAVKEFSRQLVKGTGSSGEFVGMNKYCTDNDLVSEIEFDLTGKLTSSKAESFYADFTEMLGSLRVDANAIITDRTLESKLVALEGLLHKNVVKATIGKVDYNTYQGLNILPVENGTCLRTVDAGTTTDTYIDFYVVRLSTTDGVFCASPNGAANFVKAIKPVENGTPLATGYVDFATCFIPKNKGAIIKGSVKISSVAKG